MIEKMKFVSITGPKADIDRMVNSYLCKYEIHLENALSQLTTVRHLSPYQEVNPYKEALAAASGFCEELKASGQEPAGELTPEEALSIIRRIQEKTQEFSRIRKELEEKQDSLSDSLHLIRPFRNIDFDISSILKFRHIHYRFGRMEKEYFEKFQSYIFENPDTIFVQCETDDQYVWCVYFTPASEARRIHATYAAMHFEKTYIPDQYHGTAQEAYQALDSEYRKNEEDLKNTAAERQAYLESCKEELRSARQTLERYSRNFDIRKLAACTQAPASGAAGKEVFYILCGWMTEKEAHAFQQDIRDDSSIFCLVEENEENLPKEAPTKLKNLKLFRPFEMYTKMYGLPAYGEMDPTWFMAVTYSFIFGAMFGDVGQGLLLFIGGFLLYRFRHIDLAGIISCAGLFSTFFGFMFGSLFGFEDILPALWLHPMSAMVNLPLVGRLNTVFVVAIGFGMLLILICMVLNIVSSLKSHDTEKAWFDANGAAGLVFYGSIVLIIGLFISGHRLPGGVLLAIMFGIPLLLMFLKEPLTHLVEKRAKIMPEQKGVFFVQSFFELFEVLLSFLSNTLSFLRIGAFAVSHAAMMEVVLMLAGAANGGSPNWIVIVLGNLFVCAMEGLIVGIQVLRLEYYELFSRFYKGGGREFHPFLKKTAGM